MTREPTQSERHLVDIAWQLVYMTRYHEKVREMTTEELATWVGEQLRACGYENEPIGAGWHYVTGVKE